MNDLFKQAVETVSRLPAEEQERIAALMLEALGGEHPAGRAEGLSGMPDDSGEPPPRQQTRRFWISGQRPTLDEARAAVEGLKALRKNLHLGGLSIREMIEAGRR